MKLDDFELWIAGMIVDDLPVEIVETIKRHEEHRETVFETICHKLALRKTSDDVRKVFDYTIDYYDEVQKQLEV